MNDRLERGKILDATNSIELNSRMIGRPEIRRFVEDNPNLGLSLEVDRWPIDKLIEAGYVMFNYLGWGTKPIVQQIKDDKGNIVADFSDKVFLTQEDIDLVKKYTLPENFAQRDIEETSAQMHKFIRDAGELAAFRVMMKDDDFIKYHIEDVKKVPRNIPTVIHLIDSFLDEIGHKRFLNSSMRNKYQRLNLLKRKLQNVEFKWKEMLKTLTPDELESILRVSITSEREKYLHMLPENYHGIALNRIRERSEGQYVVGRHSPILTSDYIFGRNEGIYIFDDGYITGTPTAKNLIPLRLNDAAAEVASIGISNTGTPEDPDQRYITIKEFFNKVLTEPNEGSVITREEILDIQDKVEVSWIKALMKKLGLEDLLNDRQLRLITMISEFLNYRKYDELIEKFLAEET